MKTITSPHSLQRLSGEELLLMSIFSNRRIQSRIDRELDRRARYQPANTPVTARSNRAA